MNSYVTVEEIEALQESGLPRNGPFIITGVSRGMFSVARHFGGCRAYGYHYTYNPVTYELFREDVLKWIAARRKAQKKARKEAADFVQMDLI